MSLLVDISFITVYYNSSILLLISVNLFFCVCFIKKFMIGMYAQERALYISDSWFQASDRSNEIYPILYFHF